MDQNIIDISLIFLIVSFEGRIRGGANKRN